MSSSYRSSWPTGAGQPEWNVAHDSTRPDFAGPGFQRHDFVRNVRAILGAYCLSRKMAGDPAHRAGKRASARDQNFHV
jgi:hypothetical protein